MKREDVELDDPGVQYNALFSPKSNTFNGLQIHSRKGPYPRVVPFSNQGPLEPSTVLDEDASGPLLGRQG